MIGISYAIRLCKLAKIADEHIPFLVLFLYISNGYVFVGFTGWVWFFAQTLCFTLSLMALYYAWKGQGGIALSCWIFAVGCRPMILFYFPVLCVLLYGGSKKNKSIVSFFLKHVYWFVVPTIVGLAYLLLNALRFGDPFEFGHNYLPEFMRSEHGQLSVHYLGKNLVDFLFGPPVRLGDAGPELQKFGFSRFLSSPIFICNLVWLAEDLVKRRMNWEKALLVALGALNVVLLCMHRTLGGFQFGMRYAMELAPFCLIYLLLSERREMRAWEAALLGFGLCFNFWGACVAHV